MRDFYEQNMHKLLYNVGVVDSTVLILPVHLGLGGTFLRRVRRECPAKNYI
jgi:hypothetical protein